MQPEPRRGQRRPLGLCCARHGNEVGTELEGQWTAGGERGGCGLTRGQGRRSGTRKRQRHAAGARGGGRAPRGRRCGRWAPGPGRRAGGRHRGLDGEHGPGAPRGLRKGQACRRPGLRAPPAVRWLSPAARSHTVGGAESQWPQQSDTGAQWETETAKPAGRCPREGREDRVHRGRVRRLRPVAGNPLCSVHHPEKNKRHRKNPKTCKNLSRLFGVVTITTKSARVNKGHVSLSSHTRREKERVPREGEQGTASSGARDGPSSNLFINLLPESVLFPLYVYFPYQKMSQGVWCRSRNEYNQVELIE